MKNLRYRWLLLSGYRVIRVVRVEHTWDGETTHFSTEMVMRKGIQFKTVKIRADVADILRREIGA